MRVGLGLVAGGLVAVLVGVVIGVLAGGIVWFWRVRGGGPAEEPVRLRRTGSSPREPGGEPDP